MNEYLLEYKGYVGHGTKRYQVIAENEEEALKLAASALAEENNYIPESLKVIRKLKPSFGEES